MAPLWLAFGDWRDDVAWKDLTQRIRKYGRSQGREILIGANGMARDVDLQVLGVWGQWRTHDGHVDLSENSCPCGDRSYAEASRSRASPYQSFCSRLGFGDPPFPWLAVRPSERELWMRTRGAEIYAAGGFFAFPVLGRRMQCGV